MKVSVIFFGQLKDITGGSKLEMNDITELKDLRSALHEKFPGLAEMEYIIAVDKKVVHQNVSLEDNVEIAFLPPYSGG
jgi:molybdopterin synthase sulfur carrier subunit